MRSAWRFAVPFLALTVLVTVAFACGDDDDRMTTQEYFPALDAIFERADTTTDAAQEQLDTALGSADDLETEVTAVDAYLEATIATFDTALADIEALDEPEQVTEDQSAFLDAAEGARDLAAGFRSDLAGAETREEVDQLVVDFTSESAVLVSEGDDACVRLQAIADEEAVDVDLDCLEE